MNSNDAAMWLAAPPPTWPAAPRILSFSTLSELEACPRRWALSTADYPEVWDHNGYPQAMHLAALEGAVTHVAIETIMRALSGQGCPSVGDANAIAVLRELGGITVVLGKAIEQTLRGIKGNPRTRLLLDRTRRRLTARSAELRTRVQSFLSRLNLEPRPVPAKSSARNNEQRDHRGALSLGSYSEIGLEVEELGWKGVVDHITISDTVCEIRDFKTGLPKEEHRFQLSIYALLWWLDRVRNPTGRLADRLIISYDAGDVQIPTPSPVSLEKLRENLVARRDAVVRLLETTPPEARPNEKNCEYCGVRHLCDEYWQESFPRQVQGSWFADVQLELASQHGVMSWDGVIESCPGLQRGAKVLLRTTEIPFKLRPRIRLRILNVRVSVSEEDHEANQPTPAIVSMGALSESFVLKR